MNTDIVYICVISTLIYECVGAHIGWQTSGQSASLLCIYAPGLDVPHAYAAMAPGIAQVTLLHTWQ